MRRRAQFEHNAISETSIAHTLTARGWRRLDDIHKLSICAYTTGHLLLFRTNIASGCLCLAHIYFRLIVTGYYNIQLDKRNEQTDHTIISLRFVCIITEN